MLFTNEEGAIRFNLQEKIVESVIYKGVEICAKPTDIFSIRLTNQDGNIQDYTSRDAKTMQINDGAPYVVEFKDFPEDISVTLKITQVNTGLNIRFSAKNNTDKIIEHIEVMPLILKPFEKNGGIGKMLYPYNEGVLVDDDDLRAPSHLAHVEPTYPSLGSNGVFPNMVFAQFFAYLFDGKGLYIGAHDKERGVKAIDYYAVDAEKNIKTEIRLYSGKGFGEDFAPDFDMAYRFFDGDWQDGAEIYRDWFCKNLPEGLKKVKENKDLPEWYYDFPIILTYPVRGYHDMDEMKANELFPYVNILPYVDKFSKATGAKIMVLLMHWEGTAPWAPPYVWPPFGGEEEFDKLFNALKEKGHLLGVYCSGFSYTEKSNVLPEYDCRKILEDKEIFKAFCAGRDNVVTRNKICEGQRSGYDLCIASDKGREILNEAYAPLFNKHLDYVQILDQNHGGGQYFCYSREHNHPPCVGPWMTTEMRKLLKDWNGLAGATLLGCESAAAEPFIQNLLFSDNRFELTHFIGKAVPLYAYLYHEFAHNFMGNQVCDMLPAESFLYRIAYSFVAGDMPTLVLSAKGFLQSYWGQRDFTDIPVEEDVLAIIKNFRDFYMENKEIMCMGKMIKPIAFETEEISYACDFGRTYKTEEILSTAFALDEQKIQIFVNFQKQEKTIIFNGEEMVIPALSVCKKSI